MTIKTQKFQKIWYFLQQNFGKIFGLIFKNFQLNFLDIGQQNGWFYKILEKFKRKKLPKLKSRTFKTGFLFFVALPQRGKAEIYDITALVTFNIESNIILYNTLVHRAIWYTQSDG